MIFPLVLLWFRIYTISVKERDIINIEIKPRNKARDFLHKIYSKIEDLAFSFLLKLPESIIPNFLMNWLEHYTNKRIQELKQHTIKQNWDKTYLERAVKEISIGQQDNKRAPDKE